MRRIARVDDNQGEIVATLRELGATVRPTHTIGKGFPDLVVGWRGRNYLVEVKDGSKRPSAQELTDDERRFHQTWKGSVEIFRSREDAIQFLQTH